MSSKFGEVEKGNMKLALYNLTGSMVDQNWISLAQIILYSILKGSEGMGNLRNKCSEFTKK